jgi:hypothetical protein
MVNANYTLGVGEALTKAVKVWAQAIDFSITGIA